MHLCNDTAVTELAGLEAIPGTLTVIGADAVGPLLHSNLMSTRVAFFLTIRMRKQHWYPQAIERVGPQVSVVYGKHCSGRTCHRCEGLGVIPYYAHVDEGRCFTCQGSGASAPRATPQRRSPRLVPL